MLVPVGWSIWMYEYKRHGLAAEKVMNLIDWGEERFFR
jgi:hypothetical protein